MLTLSLLTLDPRSRQVQSEVRNPYELHRTLAKAFGDGEDAQHAARCLFRLEEDKHGWRVLVQSRTRPDWSRLTVAPGYFRADPQLRALTPHLSTGQLLAFRLRANPTKRQAEKPADKRLGDRVGLYTQEDRLAWLTRKAAAHGFALVSVTATAEDPARGRTTRGHHATFSAVRFDGLLRVTDPAALLAALENGIGAGKGVGFGLLSLALPHR